jgi:HEAT repeat protein
MKYPVKWLLVAIMIVCSAADAAAEKAESVIKDLDAVITRGEAASPAGLEAIKNSIEKNPKEILPLLLAKAESANLPDENLAVYIWAMGMTRAPEAVDHIIRLSADNKNPMVFRNAHRALAIIGGDKASEFLFRKLQGTTEPTARYELLDLLAQMQYAPALPSAIDILRQDQEKFYWQQVFIFGKYGDMAVPFLTKNITDADSNVRANAIMVLGQWLIADEAVAPLKKQFRVESDPNIRALILSSLEKTSSNVKDIRIFSEEVLQTEKDSKVVQFAVETIGNFEEMQNHIAAFKSSKKDDRALFAAEYREIYASLGKKGDYKLLAATSGKADEPQLKKLKEVILQRNTDECFYDYQKINDVIMLNRLIDAQDAGM